MKILIFFGLIVLLGCKEKDLDFKLPYDGDKLVVFSDLNANDFIKMDLQKTYPPIGKSTYIDGIKNARIKVFENEAQIDELVFQEKGFYKSTYKINLNNIPKKYRLEISAPGFDKVITDQEEIPSKPDINSYEFGEDIESKLNSGIPSKKLIINIKDKPNEDNYYMVSIKRQVGKNIFGVSTFNLDSPTQFENPCEFQYISSIVFSDVCAINGIVSFKKGIEIRYPFGVEIDKNGRDKVTIYTRQISESYYKFCKTYYTEDDLIVAFKTPYPRYTNVVGGYGIFATFNEIEKEFILKE